MKIDKIEISSLKQKIPLIIQFLDKAPSDEVYSTIELAAKLGVDYTSVKRQISSHKFTTLKRYVFIPESGRGGIGRSYLLGNPKAINILKRKSDNFGKRIL